MYGVDFAAPNGTTQKCSGEVLIFVAQSPISPLESVTKDMPGFSNTKLISMVFFYGAISLYIILSSPMEENAKIDESALPRFSWPFRSLQSSSMFGSIFCDDFQTTRYPGIEFAGLVTF